MLIARRPGTWQPSQRSGASVTVIGAGLAGVFCAEALSRRGIAYRIIDSGVPGGSCIPQLSVMPQLAATPEPRYRFSFAACQYMQSAPGYYPSVIRTLAKDSDELARLQQIAAQFPDEVIAFNEGELILNSAGWLAFDETKQSILGQVTNAEISSVRYDGQWHCLARDELISTTDHLILATGFNRQLLPEQLQVRAIGGHAVSVKTDGLTQIINTGVTLFPTYKGRSMISGTYEREPDTQVSWPLIRELLAAASHLTVFDETSAEPWLGIRAVARDRFPIVGQAPDWAKLSRFNRLSAVSDYQAGLYFCTAFGSRGATHARLAAEHLVSKMFGDPAALGLKEQRLMSPARFAIRDHKPPAGDSLG